MTRNHVYPIDRLTILFFFTLFSACEGGYKPYPNNPKHPGGEGNERATVTVALDPALGTILTDGEGSTLYVFTLDATGGSTCTDVCLDSWPAFGGEELSVKGTGLQEADFASVTRPDGSEQFTYQGHPLYYFAGDQRAGNTNGEGVGDVWFVAKPDYSVMIGTQEVAELGAVSYLTDEPGNALYYFANDAVGVSTYEDGCLDNWHAFIVDDVVAPSLLRQAEFATITRNDGAQQVTYRGRPLYYFAGDQQRGDINGEGVGDVWTVADITAEPLLNTGQETPERDQGGYGYGG